MDYIQGFIMGIAYVAPIGLQNLFVINTALTQKRSRAYITALIVIFFDITLALACFFGIGKIMELHPMLQNIILGVGSIVVIYIGIMVFKDRNTDLSHKDDLNIPILKVITTACVVTWFNPQAIIDGTMMLGAFNASLSPAAGKLFISGVATASIAWFLGLSTILSLFKKKFTPTVLKYINIVCGSIILFYGFKLFLNLLVNVL